MDFTEKCKELDSLLVVSKKKLDYLKKQREELNSLEEECRGKFKFDDVEEYINNTIENGIIKDSKYTILEATEELKKKMDEWSKMISQKKEYLEKQGGGTDNYNGELIGYLKGKLGEKANDTSTSYEKFVEEVNKEVGTFNEKLKKMKEEQLLSIADFGTYKGYHQNDDAISGKLLELKTVEEFKEDVNGEIAKDKKRLEEEKQTEYNSVAEWANKKQLELVDFDDNSIRDYSISFEKFKGELYASLRAAIEKKVGDMLPDGVPDEIRQRISGAKTIGDFEEILSISQRKADEAADLERQKREFLEGNEDVKILSIDTSQFEEDIKNQDMSLEDFQHKVSNVIETAKAALEKKKQEKYDATLKPIQEAALESYFDKDKIEGLIVNYKISYEKFAEELNNELKRILNMLLDGLEDADSIIEEIEKGGDLGKILNDAKNALKEQKRKFWEETIGNIPGLNIDEEKKKKIDKDMDNPAVSLPQFKDNVLNVIEEAKAALVKKKKELYDKTLATTVKEEGLENFFDTKKEIPPLIEDYKTSYEDFDKKIRDELIQARKNKFIEVIIPSLEIEIEPGPFIEKIGRGESLNTILPEVNELVRSKLAAQKREIFNRYKGDMDILGIDVKPFEADIDNESVKPDKFEKDILEAIDKAKAALAQEKEKAYEEALKEARKIGKGDKLSDLEPGKSDHKETLKEYKDKLDARIKELELSKELDDLKSQFEALLKEIEKLDPKSHDKFAPLARDIFDGKYDKDEKELAKKMEELNKIIAETTKKIKAEIK